MSEEAPAEAPPAEEAPAPAADAPAAAAPKPGGTPAYWKFPPNTPKKPDPLKEVEKDTELSKDQLKSK